MQPIIDFIVQHSSYAPWMTFILILLAGLNLPISLDAIIVLSAFLAATTIPEHTLPLYFSILIGAYFSAWVSYWVGRTVGTKLLKLRYFAKRDGKRNQIYGIMKNGSFQRRLFTLPGSQNYPQWSR